MRIGHTVSVRDMAGGCLVRGVAPGESVAAIRALLEPFGLADLAPDIVAWQGSGIDSDCLALGLCAQKAELWAPHSDTLGLASTLQLDPRNDADLAREIVVAMLLSPALVEFPSTAEFASAVRIRMNIVRASRNTMLAFHTSQAERPADCWRYDEDRGFVIRPQASLITALIKATQPQAGGELYAFSCYRATEYVIVLAIAQEIERCNPALFARLQAMWTQRPIKSGEFHDVFLREQGTMEAPLPPRYFVPGDRAWFRNPDEASADASGFEGSWVMYMGNGEFSNFWNREAPYTLTEKCLEIYHWRHGLYFDDEGEQRIDEAKVAQLVKTSTQDEGEVRRILAVMERFREPRGVYTDAGGCIDTTREFPRWVHPSTSDIELPEF